MRTDGLGVQRQGGERPGKPRSPAVKWLGRYPCQRQRAAGCGCFGGGMGGEGRPVLGGTTNNQALEDRAAGHGGTIMRTAGAPVGVRPMAMRKGSVRSTG